MDIRKAKSISSTHAFHKKIQNARSAVFYPIPVPVSLGNRIKTYFATSEYIHQSRHLGTLLKLQILQQGITLQKISVQSRIVNGRMGWNKDSGLIMIKKMVDGKGGSQKPSTTMLTERNCYFKHSLRS